MAHKHIRSWAVLAGMLLALLLLTGSPLFAQDKRALPDGVVRVVFRAQREAYRGKWTGNVLETVRRVLEKRAHNRGVTKATFTAERPDQIVAELPRAQANKAFLQYLTSPARLEFYILPQLGSRDGSVPAKWRLSEDPKTREDILVDIASGQPLTKRQKNAMIFNRPAPLTGKTLLPHCQGSIQPGIGKPVLSFEFNAEGSRTFAEITGANIGNHLAIFLDKRLLTAPIINAVISGKGVLEGNFTLESVKDLAAQLNAGFLPVPVEIIRR
jgi:preprotein translocase subunit SecD